MRTLDKYKQNLSIRGNQVWSYTTHVATIDGNDLYSTRILVADYTETH